MDAAAILAARDKQAEAKFFVPAAPGETTAATATSERPPYVGAAVNRTYVG